MQYVYLLKSLAHEFVYVGCTSDLEKRVAEHNAKKAVSTAPYAPFQLCYFEAYLDPKDAFRREHKLKHSGAAIGHLKNRAQNSLAV